MAAIRSGSTDGCYLIKSSAALKRASATSLFFMTSPANLPASSGCWAVLPSEHIHSQCDITQLGQHSGPLAGIFVMPPPFVHHQHCRLLAFHGAVFREISLEQGIAGPVLDFTG